MLAKELLSFCASHNSRKKLLQAPGFPDILLFLGTSNTHYTSSLIKILQTNLQSHNYSLEFFSFFSLAYNLELRNCFYELLIKMMKRDRSTLFNLVIHQLFVSKTFVDCFGGYLKDSYDSNADAKSITLNISVLLTTFMTKQYTLLLNRNSVASFADDLDQGTQMFCKLINDWMTIIPEICVMQTLQPSIITMILSTIGLTTKLQYLLDLLNNAYSKLLSFPKNPVFDSLIQTNLAIWSSKVNSIGLRCIALGSTSHFIKTLNTLLKFDQLTILKHSALLFMLSRVEESGLNIWNTSINLCADDPSFATVLGPSLKSWIVRNPQTQESLRLFMNWYAKSSNKHLDPEIYQALTNCLSDTGVSGLVLEIPGYSPEEELVEYIPDLSICLQQSKTNFKAVELLMKIRRRLVLGVDGRGVEWFEARVRECVESLPDGNPGLVALAKDSMDRMDMLRHES